MTLHWPTGVHVHLNPARLPCPVEDFEKSIRYACWSIKERTGIDIRYAGQSSEEWIDGAITMFVALPEDYIAAGITDYLNSRDIARSVFFALVRTYLGQTTLARVSIFTLALD